MAAQSSNQQSQWKLRVSQGVGTGQSFHLGPRTRLGQKKASEIVLADQQSSGLHAVIQRQANNYVITDQNSINGTFVNGVRIQSPTTLHPGDTISIGSTHFVVEREASAPDTIERQRSTKAQTPGDVQQVSSDSQPRTRKRMIFLIIISLLVVSCLCCFVLGIIENYY
jgi:pSer/pThr/pTyr-binding forkhead associated (FHA) protein